MPGKNVAVEDEVVAKPGLIPYSDTETGVQATYGTWSTKGSVRYKAYLTLLIGGKSVIHEASCTFEFVGEDKNKIPVTGEETVVLSARTTIIQKGQHSVLVDKDIAIGDFGNTLEVVTSNRLKTG